MGAPGSVYSFMGGAFISFTFLYTHTFQEGH